MKNYGKKIAALGFILSILSAQNIFAQTDKGTSDTDGKNYDFWLSGIYDSGLFPEYNYQAHPSILGTAPSVFFTTDGDFFYNETSADSSRTDGAIGAKGGTLDELNSALGFDLGAGLWLPQTTGILNGTLVLDLHGAMNKNYTENRYENYNAPSEYKVSQSTELPFSLGFSALKSLDSRPLSSGFILGYDYRYTPAFYTWVSDSSQDPVLAYTSGAGREKNIHDHAIKAKADAGLTLAKRFRITGALGYSLTLTDMGQQYIAIDTDGDQFNDEVVLFKDYLNLRPEDGGPSGSNYISWDGSKAPVSLDQKDFTIGNLLNLDVQAAFLLSETFDLFADFSYVILDYSERNYYQHIKTDLMPGEDYSDKTETFSTDRGSLSVALTGKLADNKHNLSYRANVGYGRRGIDFSQDGKNPSSTDLYHALNSGHYLEANLGPSGENPGDPANNSITDLEGIIPYHRVEQSIWGEIGVEWNSSPRLKLLYSIGINAGWTEEAYAAFNLDTHDVWEETVYSDSLAWDIRPKLAVSLPFGKKGAFTTQIMLFNLLGSGNNHSETLPYNVTQKKETTNGAIDNRSDGAFNFNINFGLVFKL